MERRGGDLNKLNLLFSYEHFKRNSHYFDTVLAVSSLANVLIDSGAYSNRTRYMKQLKSGVNQGSQITLSMYEGACKEFGNKVWGYFLLDVMGNPKKTHSNFMHMVDSGFTPIPIVTSGQSDDTIKKYFDVSKRVGVGSIVASNSKVLSRLGEISGNTARLHMLGYTKFPNVLTLPYVKYFDSSSFMSGGRYGNIMTFRSKYGFFSSSLKKIVKGWADGDNNVATLRTLAAIGVKKEDIIDAESSKVELHVCYCVS
jgi:hypothetical protein